MPMRKRLPNYLFIIPICLFMGCGGKMQRILPRGGIVSSVKADLTASDTDTTRIIRELHLRDSLTIIAQTYASWYSIIGRDTGYVRKTDVMLFDSGPIIKLESSGPTPP
jgi:hypothetical protein